METRLTDHVLKLDHPAWRAAREDNRLRAEDRAAHDWYRFVLSFPPHLVRDYIKRFGIDSHKRILDPFCGTGTTLVECKKLGIPSVGVEAHPMACFASRVKVNWSVDPDSVLNHAQEIARLTLKELAAEGVGDADDLPLFPAGRKSATKLRTLQFAALKLLLRNSISPLPLHKVLVLLDTLRNYRDERFDQHERLALAKALVFGISNLEFGPEVGVGPPKRDAAVVETWLNGVRAMADDLRELQDRANTEAIVYQADSRSLLNALESSSIDAVLTSPPYPNEKDYTRTTRLESVLLGFIRSKQDLRALKQDLVRSNTRGAFKTDRDDLLVADHDEIQRIAEAIETRRLKLGKTSGFARLYARVTKLYFGGMLRHLSELRTVLRPGAQLAYVVGDQASYLRVMIRTGQLLADIAESLGYELVDLELFRTRLATATKEQLREEVVVLRWPGTITTNRSILSFRYRKALPESIKSKAPEGQAWIIRGIGRGKYRFALVADKPVVPNESMTATKVPDSTPGVVAKYALSDEQALLAKVRYNRLVDIFTGVTCYSLQNHLRTTAPEIGQVETDEIYVGVDKKGAHYVFPIQAKAGNERISIVQIEQDLAVCGHKFPSLVCRPLAAQFMADDVIAMFEFEEGGGGLGIGSEKHYKLVPPEEVTESDLETYRTRTLD